MEYIILGIVIVLVIVFLSYVGLTSFAQKQRNENLKEENAHRDFSEINPRAGQDAFKHRGK